MVKLRKLAALGGVAGPVLFTAGSVVSSLRQAGVSAAGVQLSGLAADDARDPQIMMTAFVVLGACSAGFGAAPGRVSGRPGSAGPWLVAVAGAAAVAAGVFRRDHMLLTGPGFASESWHNQLHDVASGVAYAAMLAAPLVLARRFRHDPGWVVVSRPVQALALASAVALAVFATRAGEPWNAVVQRVAVTLALTAEIVMAARMVTLPPAPAGRPPGRPGAATDGEPRPWTDRTTAAAVRVRLCCRRHPGLLLQPWSGLGVGLAAPAAAVVPMFPGTGRTRRAGVFRSSCTGRRR
jgi:Protein of unknown function (DUF998)